MTEQLWVVPAGAPAAEPRTVVDAVTDSLTAIAATEPYLHALLHVDPAGSLSAGRRLDRARALGRETGPLTGRTLVVKDNVAVRGMPLTCGSGALPHGLVTRDAPLVRRIRAAGGVVVGKANLDEFGMGATTETSAFGATRNPHDATRTPGGSSGGSAAAVAVGQVPLAVGTDTGGSIREPAAQCGVVGVKPSPGGISRRGVVPFAPSLDQAGALAATVADAALLHEVMSGWHGLAEAARAGAAAPRLEGHRVGVVVELSGAANASGVRSRLEHALGVLEGLGADVVEISVPSALQGLAAYYAISSFECVASLAPYERREMLGTEAQRRLDHGRRVAAHPRELSAARRSVRVLRTEVAAAFARCTILASPTMPVTAPRLGLGLDDPMSAPRTDCWTVLANLTGIPALSLPHGLCPDTALPVGVQLMAPRDLDARLYRVAAALESAG